METQNVKWMEIKALTKIVKKTLKATYPGVKFSVRKDRHSIRVEYYDGPTKSEVEKIARVGGEGFDGMIDMRYLYYHWFNPKTNDIQVAGTFGTVGSGGSVSEFWNPKPSEDYEMVKITADFVFVSRLYTKEGATKMMDLFTSRAHLYGNVEVKESYQGFDPKFSDRRDSENFWRESQKISLL